MEDDWDLHAVVRSCSSSSTTAAAAASSSFSAASSKNSIHIEQERSFKDPWEPSSSFVEDLHQLWKPLFNKQQILPISPLSVLQDLPSSEPLHQEIKQFQPQKHHPFSLVHGSTKTSTPRSKKRKNHSKKVCHVPAESLASDTWSWRKYGQKPIKGSPYPRGYYRCSTLKGCMARKQVERNRSDPGMFIVTYTGDHSHPVPTHRNSLAGSTRQKPASDDPKKPPSSPEKMESSREDLAEMEEDEEDDDFFSGLKDFTGDCSPENMQFPWLAATTAAGGG